MNDYPAFIKVRSSELLQEWHAADKKKNLLKKKQIMQRVIANITMGNHDMINLFPEVLSLFQYEDVKLKRLCYHYLTIYGTFNPDIAIKFLPIILQDSKSNNNQLVKLALRNITGVALKDYFREAIRPIKNHLENKDPQIRRLAIFSIARLQERDPQLVIDENLIDRVRFSLGDSSRLVVAAALQTLLDIYETDHSFDLNFTLDQALILTDLLPKADEWQQTTLLNGIMSFVPQDRDDSHILIDKVIPMLQHSNSAVVLSALKLIIYLLNYIDFIEDYLTKKLATSLTALLSKPAQIQFLVLRNVILLILSRSNLIPFDVKFFFCKYDDPIYIKDTKLEIIYLLASESNLESVLIELQEYGTDVDTQMSRKAIRAIGNLAIKFEAAAQPCVDTLLELISFGVGYIIQEAVIVFKNILRRYDQFDYIVEQILKQSDHVEDSDSKASLIWIVGQYVTKIQDPESTLADLTQTFKENTLDIQLESLTAVAKLSLQRPDKGGSLALKVLKWATEEVDNPDVRDRGFFYWRLLSVQDKYPDTVKEIINGKLPPISNENEQMGLPILRELELNIGSLASIYLKPVSDVFRLARRKSIVDSPVRSAATTKSSNTMSCGHDSSLTTSEDTSHHLTERHINEYDVPALNVKPVKKHSGFSRRMTFTKSALSRKLSIRGSFI